MQKITAKVPGKLILSGEHAVVYGKPAIAMAIDRFATTTITPQTEPKIFFNLLDFNYQTVCSMQELHELKDKLLQKYQKFVTKNLAINKILQKPIELIQFTLISFLDHFQLKIKDGLQIEINSTIPIGCGLGSSAAVILSIIGALADYFQLKLIEDEYFKIAQIAEKLQHGYPSGIDVYTSLHGGCVYFQQDAIKPCNITNELSMFMVNTGVPSVSTGECVAAVAEKFQHSEIWSEFGTITNNLFNVLVTNEMLALQKLIRENHRLLVEIGVVPARVQSFIADIEQLNGAAKTSGAGSVTGDNAGIVLVAFDVKAVQDICARYNYELIPVQFETRGLRVV